MTRENKLALVVGFGLILFVGILISDHFSIVRTQQPADLTRQTAMIDPVAHSRVQDAIVDLTPRPHTPPAVSPTTMTGGGATPIDPVRPEQRTLINPDGSVPPVRIVQQPGSNITADAAPAGFAPVPDEPPAVKVRFHDVRGGETLFGICRQYYGDASLVKALAKYNNMDDAASVRVGRRLMIPPAEVLGGRSAMTAQAQAAAPTPPTNSPIRVVSVGSAAPAAQAAPRQTAANTYTVRPGDSLAGIAQRFLGSQTHWRKLHEMNRDVIDDPNSLKVGTVLRVL